MDVYDFIKDGKIDFDAIEELKEVVGYIETDEGGEFGNNFFIRKLYGRNKEVNGYALNDAEGKTAVFNKEEILDFVMDKSGSKTFEYSADGKSCVKIVELKEDGSYWIFKNDGKTLEVISFANGGGISFFADGKSVKTYKRNNACEKIVFSKSQGRLLAGKSVEDIKKGAMLAKQMPNLVFRINSDGFVNEFAYNIDERCLPVVSDEYKAVYKPHIIKDEDVSEVIKYLGGKIVRKVNDFYAVFDEENNDFVFVDEKGERVIAKSAGIACGGVIEINEDRFILEEKDYNEIKKIELEVKKEVKKAKDNASKNPEYAEFGAKGVELAGFEAMVNTLEKMDKKYVDLYVMVLDNNNFGTSVTDVLNHETKHVVDLLLYGYRKLADDYKNPTAEEQYKLKVEHERVASFCELNKTIKKFLVGELEFENAFGLKYDWIMDKFEGCSIEEIREKMYPPTEIMNEALKRWNDGNLNCYFNQFKKNCIMECCEALYAPDDYNGEEYRKQLSLLYTFEVYNPNTNEVELLDLSSAVEVGVPIDEMVKREIIKCCREKRVIAKKNLKAMYPSVEDRKWAEKEVTDMKRKIVSEELREKLDFVSDWLNKATHVGGKMSNAFVVRKCLGKDGGR